MVGLKGWQTNASKNGGFDRVRYTGKKVYMPSSLKVKPNGLEIGFTQPLDKAAAEDAEGYAIKGQQIQWTHRYGSRETKVKGLEVTSAKLLPDGKSVFVEVKGLKPIHQVQLRLDIKADDGQRIKDTIYHTIHRLK